jgi:peptide-methionine (S)-S-oxide reductase
VLFSRDRSQAPKPQQVQLDGYEYPVPETHYVNGNRILPPFPTGLATAVFALGCFWGEEKTYWELPGVWSTAAGYAGGKRPFPTYDDTCTGLTGHAESVLVVYDPAEVSYEKLLSVFWESHDPTQGNRQGNDVGSQYRSAIFYADDAQRQAAETSRATFQERLSAAGHGKITTEIAPLGTFYYAEAYHQQYLAKNPYGYCPDHSTGVSCPVGLLLPPTTDPVAEAHE